MELLERERHSALLEGWLREAAAGEGRLVFIGGEAGIGKSSLVRRFCRRAVEQELEEDTVRILHGGCDALSTPRPLAPFLDIAAKLGVHSRAAVAGAVERLDLQLREVAAQDRAADPPT